MPTGYSRAQIGLHWIIALLIVGQFLFNDPIGSAFRQMMRGTEPPFSWAVWAHIAGGVLILLLVGWRLSLRLARGVPPPPDTTPALKLAAHAGHWALYALVVLLPVSGLVAWFGKVGQAGGMHELLTNVLLAVVGIHVLAALYHQFWLKDRLLLRMMKSDA